MSTQTLSVYYLLLRANNTPNMYALKIFSTFLAVLFTLAIVQANPAPGGYGHGSGYGGGHGSGNSHIYRNDHGYDNYDFGYDISDHYTGDNHGRQESKRGYNVYGSYYVGAPYGQGRRVNYVSDNYGTHQTIYGSQNGLYIKSKDLTVVPAYH